MLNLSIHFIKLYLILALIRVSNANVESEFSITTNIFTKNRTLLDVTTLSDI